MRILCVTHAYPRWDGDVAGAFIERLLAALARRTHEIAVVAPADQGRGGGGREVRRGVLVKRVRYAPARWETLAYRGTMLEAARSPAGWVAFLGLVAQLARRTRAQSRAMSAQLVHAHWWMPAGMSAWLARRAGGPPYIVTLHGTDVALLGRVPGARVLARRVLRDAAAVTAVSSFLAERAARATGLEQDGILVRPMPVDVDLFARASRGGGGVVTVGRLSAQKQVGLVIDALAILKRQGRPLPLTIIGDGPERQALERRAAASGVAAETRFVGQVPPQGIPEAIGDADVFAFAAVGEGLGLAAVEALMLGVPVVAMEGGGGVVDVVPATGPGRLVKTGDAEALARAIAELAGDPEARRLAAEAGARLKQRFDPETAAQDFETVYRAALTRGGAGRTDA